MPKSDKFTQKKQWDDGDEEDEDWRLCTEPGLTLVPEIFSMF